MPDFDAHPTPNPNSLKFTTDAGPFVEDGMISFRSAEEAAGHPLGAALFALEGVADVFALPQFLTVTKHPAASWDVLLTGIEKALARYFEAREAP